MPHWSSRALHLSAVLVILAGLTLSFSVHAQVPVELRDVIQRNAQRISDLDEAMRDHIREQREAKYDQRLAASEAAVVNLQADMMEIKWVVRSLAVAVALAVMERLLKTSGRKPAFAKIESE